MKPTEFVEVGWAIVQLVFQVLWFVAGAVIVLLLFIEFVLGIDFIAWIAGDPIGDILSWMREVGIDVKEAFREKAERIEDSYNDR